MARARVQLVVPDALDDNLVEPDTWDAKPGYRRADGHAPAGEPDAVRDSFARRRDGTAGLLLLPLLPGEIRLICALGVPQASMAKQRRSGDAQADACAPGYAISRHDGL